MSRKIRPVSSRHPEENRGQAIVFWPRFCFEMP
jgi:hypothetical protein